MKLNINKHQQTQTQQKLNLKPKPSWWSWISPLQTSTKILWSKPKHKHKLNPSFSCKERKETQTQKCILIHWSKPTLQSTPTLTELRFCKILIQTQKTLRMGEGESVEMGEGKGEWVRVNRLGWMGEGLRVNRWGEGELIRVNGWGWIGEWVRCGWIGEWVSVKLQRWRWVKVNRVRNFGDGRNFWALSTKRVEGETETE